MAAFGKFVTPDSVKEQQQDVAADLRTLQDAFNRCTSLDAAQRVQWAAMQDRIGSFLSQDPSWLSTSSQADEGDAIKTDMAKWHAIFNSAGCNSGDAPTQAKGFDLSTAFQQLTSSPVLLLALLFLLSRQFGKR